MDVAIIDVDCATRAQNTGLAWAIQNGEKLVVWDMGGYPRGIQ